MTTTAERNVTGTAFTRGLGVVTIAGIVLLVILGLFVSPADVNQGESVRIMYAHVPGAWLAYLAFIVTAVSSAAYLWPRTRSLTWDR
ncbi:MAG: cytochrome C assembly protein, partial [Actinobacteria bacterium]|nr:cytochrome C assembly protein [Actinomycetota bacterium]